MSALESPLTLGTAGHVDHGKTALARALTGVECDRLPEEKARGLTIVLGYALLVLPSGRRLSVVDVPGHERFVRTMVSGATGIDAFLMVVAADDGVMPQTVEHAEVLRALGVDRGVIAITKADLADPATAAAEAAELYPGCEVVPCSTRSGTGLEALTEALDRLVARTESRAHAGGPAVLHVDRVFSAAGRGTVVTGTLWSGELASGDEVSLLPAATAVRIRGLQVHGEQVEQASAGQRVAVNLARTRVRDVQRGDVLTTSGTLAESRVLDCALELRNGRNGERVQVHHGTRDVAARATDLGDGLWQLRLERPLLTADGDHIVVRRLSPPDTLGGGVILDAAARRHGRRPDIMEQLRRRRNGKPLSVSPPPPRNAGSGAAEPAATRPLDLEARAAALEERLRVAGPALLSEAQLAEDRYALRELRATGRAVRVQGRLYAHAEVIAEVRSDVVALLEAEGGATLPRVRDALGLSRKSAQAFLEHLDAMRVTRRLADDRRILVDARTKESR